MAKFILRRILLIIPVMLGVITIIFVLRAITPGDPVDQLLSTNATEEEREAKREELGLNDPLIVQYVTYLGDVVTGDFGESYKTHQNVLVEVMQKFPCTLIVCFGAVVLGALLGIPMGILSALRQYTWTDSIVLILSMVFAACPGFVLALLLVSIFSVNLHLLPATGIQGGLGYILPMVTVGMASLSSYTRITRSSFLEVIRQDYIRTARAKGQTEKAIVVGHALRNALIPIVASIGVSVGNQLGGALIVETVFGMPGIGKYIGDAITARDFPAIQGGVLFLALVFTVVNLLVDLSFVFINPRLKSNLAYDKVKKPKAEKSAVKSAV